MNSLELAQAEKIDTVNQPTANWKDAATFTEKRLEVLKQIQERLPKEEGPFLESEQQFLNNSLEFIQTFSEATQKFVEEETENTKRIQQEIEKHKPDQEGAQTAIDQVQQAINAIDERTRQADATIEELSQKKRDLADKLNPEQLSKIVFKDFLDENHNIFRWVLQVIYKESRTSYSEKNFKKQVFKTDKGIDFLARAKGLNLAKLRKDDFHFGKEVMAKKDQFLAELEPKGKENAALRSLFDYINTVSEVGDLHDVLENGKTELDEQKKQIEKKQSEKQKISNLTTVLEGKVKASQIYLEKLERLNPLFNRLKESIQQRQEVQRQYRQSLNGDAGASENLINNVQVRQTTQQYSEQRSNQGLTEQRSLYTAQGETDKNTYQGQEARVEGGEEEEGFGGHEVTADGTKGKKVESKYPVPATDLKESEFANSKKGSCESCNIF